MSQELIYTSAARGLRAGSSGLCTVAATQGLSQKLEEKLVALSGYRAVGDPGNPHAPVAWGHYKLMVSGRLCHVLSRVSDSGSNGGQRPNKLAHHVVLSPDELPAAGPAWLLSQPGFMQAAWQGDPRHLPARPILSGSSPAAVCTGWQDVAGDSGWGGVLAETALSGRQVTIIYQVAAQLLPLLAESLALLPAEQRWEVTFSTHAVELPPAVGCRWRGVLAGSPEAVDAKRSSQILVIDLTQPLGPPPDSAYVRAARCGVTIRGPAAAPPSPATGNEPQIVATKPPDSACWTTSQPMTPNQRRIWVATASVFLIATAIVLARQGHLAMARRGPSVGQASSLSSSSRQAGSLSHSKPALPKVYQSTVPAPVAVAPLAIDPGIRHTEVAALLPEGTKEVQISMVRIAAPGRENAPGTWAVVGEPAHPRLELTADERGLSRPIRFDVSFIRNDSSIVLRCTYAGFDTKDLVWEPMEKLLTQQRLLKPDNVAAALKWTDLQLGNLRRPINELSTEEQRLEFERHEQRLKDQRQAWQQVSDALKTASAGWLVHYDLFITVDEHRVLVGSTDLEEARSRTQPANSE